MWLYVLVGVLAFSSLASAQPVAVGAFQTVYKPSLFLDGEEFHFIVRGHTLVLGPGGMWHLLGTTHTTPSDMENEVNLSHATKSSSILRTDVPSTSVFEQMPFAMGAYAPSPWQEGTMWSPHIALDTYYMVYCSAASQQLQQIEVHLAISKDLWSWQRVAQISSVPQPMGSVDPMLVNLGPNHNNTWALYSLTWGTGSPANLIEARLSQDLVTWSSFGTTVFTGEEAPCRCEEEQTVASPFVIRRDDVFYLFVSFLGNGTTRVFSSLDPLNFGSLQGGSSALSATIDNTPYAEILRDTSGEWYMSTSDPANGVALAVLSWSDGLSTNSTSVTVPSSPLSIPVSFSSTISPVNSKFFQSSTGVWTLTPSGLNGGYALGDSFYVSAKQYTDFTFSATITLATNDGDPPSRIGSAAGLVYRIQNPADPLSGSWLSNLNTEANSDGYFGQIKIIDFPYNITQVKPTVIVPGVPYLLETTAVGNTFTNKIYANGQFQASITADDKYPSGNVAFNVWQGAALFQDVTLCVGIQPVAASVCDVSGAWKIKNETSQSTLELIPEQQITIDGSLSLFPNATIVIAPGSVLPVNVPTGAMSIPIISGSGEINGTFRNISLDVPNHNCSKIEARGELDSTNTFRVLIQVYDSCNARKRWPAWKIAIVFALPIVGAAVLIFIGVLLYRKYRPSSMLFRRTRAKRPEARAEEMYS